jgi:hypothetical protein
MLLLQLLQAARLLCPRQPQQQQVGDQPCLLAGPQQRWLLAAWAAGCRR